MCNQSETVNNRTQWQKEKKDKQSPKKHYTENWKVLYKECWFRPYSQTNMAATDIFFSDWPISKNLLLWNCSVKWTKTWLKASMEGLLCIILILSRSVNKHGCHRQFLFMIGRSLKNILLWNRLAKWTKAWLKASMEDLLYRLLILSRSVYKLGRQRHLLFLVGRFLKISSPLTPLVQMNRNLVGSIYWRSSMQIANFVPIC